MLRLVLKKEPFKMADVYYSLCGVLYVLCVLSDYKYEKIIILSVVMMQNDIIISLD